MSGKYYFPLVINHSIPITAVMGDYGLENSTKKMVHCPDIDHEDKNPSAKIYLNTNGCKCMSCGAFLRPIDIVMQQENASFYQACEILVERYGLGKECYEEYPDRTIEERTTDQFPLSYEDMILLRFKVGVGNVPVKYKIQQEGYYDEDMHYRHYKEDYEVTEKEQVSIRRLFEEDREAFSYILQERLDNILEEQEKTLDSLDMQLQLAAKDLADGCLSLKNFDLQTLVKQHLTGCKFPSNSQEEKMLQTYLDFRYYQVLYQDCKEKQKHLKKLKELKILKPLYHMDIQEEIEER